MLQDRLHRLSERGACRNASAEDLVRAGLVDIVRTFVKQEPHKRAKLDSQRYRLIFVVSLIDSLVERVLYQKRTKFEVAHWQDIPSKPGMGATDEALAALRRNIERLLREGGLLDTDIKGWDWQLKWWIAYCAFYANMIRMGVRPGTTYFEIAFNREVSALRAVFSLSDGQLFVLLHASIMLSGRFVTSFFNSSCRSFAATLAGSLSMCMGDDCCEGVPEDQVNDVLSCYASFGYEGKMEHNFSTSPEEVIFCSCRYYADTAEPVNWLRMLYRYISSNKLSLAHYVQFAFEVRHLRGLPSGFMERLQEMAIRGREVPRVPL